MAAYGCLDWQEAIAAYLDGELAPIEEQRVHAHLRSCKACSEALIDLVPLVQALRSAPKALPPRDLWPRILAELRQDPGFSRRLAFRTRRRMAFGATAAAAAVVCMATLGQRWAPAASHADIDTYWHEHALYSQAAGVPGMYAPSLHAVQSSYELDP